MQITVINDEALWPAVVRRERAADGEFFYWVQTTGKCPRHAAARPTPPGLKVKDQIPLSIRPT